MKNVHIGTMGWSYSFWKSIFYPKDLNQNQFLKYYSTKLDTVEVNNTFYRIPNPKTILTWKKQTPDNFVFSIKFPRKITHFKMLSDVEDDTNYFLKIIKILDTKLGPLLIQLPSNFPIKKATILTNYLDNLPKTNRYALEIRNKSLLNDELLVNLRKNKIALVWIDHTNRPQIEETTTDFLYIRWQGNRKKVNGSLGKTEVDQIKNIKTWSNKIKQNQKKIKEIFGYFSKFYSGNPTKDSFELNNLLTTK